MAEISAVIKKTRLFGFSVFLPKLRRFVFIAAEFVFFFFSPPFFSASRFTAEIGGNAAEIPGKQMWRFCFGYGAFFGLRLIFWNVAGISAAMRCSKNFRRKKF